MNENLQEREKPFKAKRHRGPHKWTPWKYLYEGKARQRECTIEGCAAYDTLFAPAYGGKKYGCRPERWNSGKWKRKKAQS